ncbi:MAG: Cof-type HAD-IIB family hydrolase [Clostridia bacterium]|nr:Cof-type HAD-IIB family hydrolase [Clostridia bacterium]
MKKFDGILFCTDIDGTLYNDDKTISDDNLQAIEYFKSEGGLFTFITGRHHIVSGEIYNAIKPNAPIGCLNGGGVYDYKKGEFLWCKTLPQSAMELVREVHEKLPAIGYQLNVENNIYFCRNNKAMEYLRSIMPFPPVDCDYSDVNDTILKVVFAVETENEMSALIDLLNIHPMADDFDFIRSDLEYYEILPKGTSKGIGLKKLAELMGIDMKKTVAVGDYDNDISMISVAGTGYAVANAKDNVKAVADYVTASNNEHAIAKIIDDIDSGKVLI